MGTCEVFILANKHFQRKKIVETIVDLDQVEEEDFFIVSIINHTLSGINKINPLPNNMSDATNHGKFPKKTL
jgi:hypothetical protein